jgi:hypothetical protein
MQMKADKAAEDLYVYGKHVEGSNGGSLSLSEMATTSERSIVSQLDSFTRFYDDNAFIDKVIKASLRGDGIWNDEQRQLIVLKSLQVNVMYFGVLQAAYEAVSDCAPSSTTRSSIGSTTNAWDKTAAMLVGSLEGTETDGSPEGYFFHSLAQEHCEEFGTCGSVKNAAEVNLRLINLLYSGRGAVLGNSCAALRKITGELADLLLIPTIQGALMSAINLSKSGSKNNIHRAEAYVYSRALLPLVTDVDRDAAATIEKNLGDLAPNSEKQIASEVFSAFAKVYPGMGVDCKLIGSTKDFDPCEGVVYGMTGSSSAATTWAIIGTVIALGLLAIVVVRRRQKRDLPENNPNFKYSDKGEFNNHSMNLLEKAFANNVPSSPDEATNRLTTTHGFSSPSIAVEDDDFDEVQGLTTGPVSDFDII